MIGNRSIGRYKHIHTPYCYMLLKRIYIINIIGERNYEIQDR